MSAILSFEQPILELEGKIEELRRLGASEVDISDEIARLESKLQKLLTQTYNKLTPWQKVQVARHPSRPRLHSFIQGLTEDFTALAGDRQFGEDAAITGGLARFNGHSVVIIGQERGTDLSSRLKHNFGMALPEGYRKAQRLMRLAERHGLPILTFIDTPGAYPGIGAEERGQAEAIAQSVATCLTVNVPVISTVIGEGGSGGAIALGCGDRILMLEHAVYSVISPEGCASILWRNSENAPDAAEALKLTAQDLLGFKVIDEIIQEPLGGAHRQSAQAIENTKTVLSRHFAQMLAENTATLKIRRQEKFLAMGRA